MRTVSVPDIQERDTFPGKQGFCSGKRAKYPIQRAFGVKCPGKNDVIPGKKGVFIAFLSLITQIKEERKNLQNASFRDSATISSRASGPIKILPDMPDWYVEFP